MNSNNIVDFLDKVGNNIVKLVEESREIEKEQKVVEYTDGYLNIRVISDSKYIRSDYMIKVLIATLCALKEGHNRDIYRPIFTNNTGKPVTITIKLKRDAKTGRIQRFI